VPPVRRARAEPTDQERQTPARTCASIQSPRRQSRNLRARQYAHRHRARQSVPAWFGHLVTGVSARRSRGLAAELGRRPLALAESLSVAGRSRLSGHPDRGRPANPRTLSRSHTLPHWRRCPRVLRRTTGDLADRLRIDHSHRNGDDVDDTRNVPPGSRTRTARVVAQSCRTSVPLAKSKSCDVQQSLPA
jgi:hypothetical protein